VPPLDARVAKLERQVRELMLTAELNHRLAAAERKRAEQDREQRAERRAAVEHRWTGGEKLLVGVLTLSQLASVVMAVLR
jgi:hypothetical protein